MPRSDSRTQAIWQSFEAALAAGLVHRSADEAPLLGRCIRLDGRDCRNFVTCSYLGLERDPRVIAAIGAAAERYGASFALSRAYVSSPQYAELEGLLAQIFDAFPLVTSTTTLGHLAFVSALIEPTDTLLLDQQVHNSVQMAAQVAGAACVRTVRHNDVPRLRRAVAEELAARPDGRVWYFGDGVYSMYGDVAPVTELAALLAEHERFHLYLDDAHGMSALGRHGRGYVLSQLTRLPPRLVLAVSFAKAFGIGGGGALVFSDPAWRRAVRIAGSTLIFSGPLSPPTLGAAIASARLHLSPEIAERQAALAARIGLFRTLADEAGLALLSSPLSPVQFVRIGRLDRATRIARGLLDAGYLVNLCAFPAVARNHAGVRVALNTHLEEVDIRGLVAELAAQWAAVGGSPRSKA